VRQVGWDEESFHEKWPSVDREDEKVSQLFFLCLNSVNQSLSITVKSLLNFFRLCNLMVDYKPGLMLAIEDDRRRVNKHNIPISATPVAAIILHQSHIF